MASCPEIRMMSQVSKARQGRALFGKGRREVTMADCYKLEVECKADCCKVAEGTAAEGTAAEGTAVGIRAD